MSQPHYVLHVGPFKTATTYLQRCLTDTRPDLIGQGVYYAEELISPRNKIMHMQAYYAAAQNDMAEATAAFQRLNQSGHRIIVLSCEHFINLDIAGLTRLRDAIGVASIDIVYYVRRWSDRIPSVWNQSLRVGSMLTLPAYCMDLLHGGRPDEDLDYTLSWQKLGQVFGRDRLRLVPYSTLVEQKRDLFEAFCTDILGVTTVPQPPKAGKSVWASMDADYSEILRALNTVFYVRHGEVSANPRESFFRARNRVDLSKLTEILSKHHATAVLDDADPVFAPIMQAMHAYADRLVGAQQGQAMFQPVRREHDYADLGYLLRPGVMDALAELYEQLEIPSNADAGEIRRKRFRDRDARVEKRRLRGDRPGGKASDTLAGSA